MRRYLRPSAVNRPVSAWGLYKSDDDQTHSDGLCCPGRRLGGNPPPPSAPTGARALPPRGPGLAPADPRYGRPAGARPLYSDRVAPTGPILSPDDPRYGRPEGPPEGIYSDRPTRPPREGYS